MLFAVAPFVVPEKPVAVFIHGAGGGGWEYKFWQPVFEKAGYRVVAPDLMPAKGGLEKTTFDDYVQQVVKAGGSKPEVLVGASMGGVIVLKAAEKLQPRTLVLVCSALPAGITIRKQKEPYPAIIKWANGPYSDTVSSMPDSDEATWKFAHPRWRDESGAVLNEMLNGIAVAKPSCPVLSVIPEGDDTVTPEDQQALAKWAGADTHRYKDMSHVGPLLSKRATEVAEAVLSWLKADR